MTFIIFFRGVGQPPTVASHVSSPIFDAGFAEFCTWFCGILHDPLFTALSVGAQDFVGTEVSETLQDDIMMCNMIYPLVI